MYRWLLCWRYLRTRYIALASVVSVTLGVATLIIVNSVMAGFTQEMQEKMHGILSDVIIESHSSSGLSNPAKFTDRIQRILGDELEGMTTVVHVPAIVAINCQNETVTRQINLIGIDTKTYASVSDFSKFLLHPENRKMLSFALQESGYAPERVGFPESGWVYRRRMADYQKRVQQTLSEIELERERNQMLRAQIDRVGNSSTTDDPSTNDARQLPTLPDEPPAFPGAIESGQAPNELVANNLDGSAADSTTGLASTTPTTPTFDAVPTSQAELDAKAKPFDAAVSQHEGIVLGIGVGTSRYRNSDGEVTDFYYVHPGDDVTVTFPTAGSPPTAINEKLTVVDFYESKMSDYDMTFAFMSLEKLQKWRGMIDPTSKVGAVSSIQLRLRKGADLDLARDRLREAFPMEMMVQVSTWRDLQGPLLAAVQMETTILNILLFLIIAVAGFGILATFFMIVVEKTKDIGIMKSLGAPGQGIASIFMGYGVLLGAVGAGVGGVLGLLFVAYINDIADVLEVVTGQEVFDPTIYYFDSIPTVVHPWTVVWVIIGAVFIAVAASVLPAIRAARMRPVEALRYE
ncbi:MAG: FtsX-like permease family protein [Pirellulaceae bacterium]|nr:FtsX-like permease family protein [Pirellulaceae bacterium]